MTSALGLEDADFPFAVNCRFSKTIIGLPKKCGYCQKMIVGTGFTCQNCSFRCHKRCVMVEQGDQMCLRLQRCALTPPGEDSVIAKLLNELNANGVDHHFPRREDKRSNSDDSNGNTPSKEGTSCGSQRRCRPLAGSPTDDPFYPSSTATSPSLLSQPSSPRSASRVYRRNTVLLTPSSTGDRRLSTALISPATPTSDEKRYNHGRFIGRLLRLFTWTPTGEKNGETRKSDSDSVENSARREAISRRTSINKSKQLLHMNSEPACHQALTLLAARSHQTSPAASMRQRVKSTVVHRLGVMPPKQERRKSAIEPVHVSMGNEQIDHSSVASRPATSTENGRIAKIQNKNLAVSLDKPTAISPLLHRIRLRAAAQEATTKSSGHKCLRTHESDPIKIVERRSAALLRGYEGAYRSRRADRNGDEEDQRERLASWPLAGYHIDYEDNDHLENAENSTDNPSSSANDKASVSYQDSIGDDTRSHQTRLSDLGEWTIPYADLVFSECVNECRNMTTYRGRWHGDVMIHTYDISGTEREQLMRGFLEEVRTLTKIRHENVALFMGASVEAPLVAVVTSIRKGCNLYEAVHIENRRLAQTAKFNIARQIAQGMGYLHAKGIVLKTLTSKSIYLECKVKISMVDDGAPLKRHDRSYMGCIRRGHLTYISPELMQTVRVAPPALTVDGACTKETDVYAFGTILYEMLAGDFPLAKSPVQSVVWLIGQGKCQSLDSLHCSASMKGLIECCWSDDPVYRPSFNELLKDLQHTAALHVKHSSSVPEKLNRIGLRPLHNY